MKTTIPLARFTGLILCVGVWLVACRSDSIPEHIMTVRSEAMMPSYSPETSFGVDETAYLSVLPQRGDVVVYNHPRIGLPGLARVVGLPGERIEIRDGSVVINGLRLNESYVDEAYFEGFTEVTEDLLLGEDEFYVITDNRSSLYIERAVISQEMLVGKAVSVCTSSFFVRCDPIEGGKGQ